MTFTVESGESEAPVGVLKSGLAHDTVRMRVRCKQKHNKVMYRGAEMFYSRASFSGPPPLRLCSAPQAQGTKCSAPQWEGPITTELFIPSGGEAATCLATQDREGEVKERKGRKKRRDCVHPRRREGYRTMACESQHEPHHVTKLRVFGPSCDNVLSSLKK